VVRISSVVRLGQVCALYRQTALPIAAFRRCVRDLETDRNLLRTLDQHVSLEDYSVSNRGLRSGLVGTPSQIAERIAEFEAVGVDLLLLQCSPQFEEMERFAENIIRAIDP